MSCPMPKTLLASVCLLACAGCGPKSAADLDDPTSVYVPPEQMPPWEIVFTRSIVTDLGDCKSLEHMDKEVHVSPQGVTVYVSHYTDADSAPSTKKLISTIPSDQEPARSVIDAIVAQGLWQHDEHATYRLDAEVTDDCSKESEVITIETPSKTGILEFVPAPEHPDPSGKALEIYSLIKDNL